MKTEVHPIIITIIIIIIVCIITVIIMYADIVSVRSFAWQ